MVTVAGIASAGSRPAGSATVPATVPLSLIFATRSAFGVSRNWLFWCSFDRSKSTSTTCVAPGATTMFRSTSFNPVCGPLATFSGCD
ncbi:MAG: hypothetical protein BWY76_03009 [bacterium ADurb.Bin429]|nr:MAG: hypothetical protein BWY76_03009 [bacterium ADurb.Bin429]